jgi:hypothetical protein
MPKFMLQVRFEHYPSNEFILTFHQSTTDFETQTSQLFDLFYTNYAIILVLVLSMKAGYHLAHRLHTPSLPSVTVATA